MGTYLSNSGKQACQVGLSRQVNSTSRQRSAQSTVIGKEGETIAARYLQCLGYDIRDRNVRLSRDEIDIIAFDPAEEAVVFIEVKARTRLSFDFRPELGLTLRKKRAMTRAARKWVAENAYEGGYRMDAVLVAEGRVVGYWRGLEWEE